jgi:hypothetical protein
MGFASFFYRHLEEMQTVAAMRLGLNQNLTN